MKMVSSKFYWLSETMAKLQVQVGSGESMYRTRHGATNLVEGNEEGERLAIVAKVSAEVRTGIMSKNSTLQRCKGWGTYYG